MAYVVEFVEWKFIQDPRLLASIELNVLVFWKRKGVAKEHVWASLAQNLGCGMAVRHAPWVRAGDVARGLRVWGVVVKCGLVLFSLPIKNK